MRQDAKYAFPVAWMCRQLEVSKSGYYDWRDRPESATMRRRRELTAQITDIFELSDGTYGYRRVHKQLERNGVRADRELVRFLMRGNSTEEGDTFTCSLGLYPVVVRSR